MRLWQSWQSGRFQCQMTLFQIQPWTFFVNQLLLLTVVKMIEGGRGGSRMVSVLDFFPTNRVRIPLSLQFYSVKLLL